jgi:hypothetical protein
MFRAFCAAVATQQAAEYTFWAIATPMLVVMKVPMTETTIMALLNTLVWASSSNPNWLAM